MPKPKPISNRQRRIQRKASSPQLALRLVPVAAPVALPVVGVEDEAAAVRAGIAETLALEARRHGTMPKAAPKAGPVRLDTRDGLASMLRSGSVSALQVHWGLAYRLCAEAKAASLKSCLGHAGEGSGGGGGGEGLAPRSAAALRRAYLMARLRQLEAAVEAEAVDGRELLVLRAVAGEGATIQSLATGGDAKARLRDALRRALDTVGVALRCKVKLANQAG